ncbi:MAG TPA: protein kinase [Polyangiaceae bacterium]|nr:protein kinase [Polyangiaceae bacterium]
MVEIGELLAGKYRVERVLGKGGMGYVVAATHTQLEQRVAIKLLMPELAVLEEPVARFLREARAAVKIRSEHVARVLDVGKLDDGTPYMVMEYLDGHDLAAELDVRGSLPLQQAIDYVLQASEAIAEAHSLGIVHRDLKPANLFLSQHADGSPLVKVLDFGISKALLGDDGSPAPNLTATQSLIGSPYYMSPEQVRKPKTVDARTDIWSLGVILYELLSGRLPFTADTAMSVLAAVVSDPPPPLREVRPDVPSAVAEIVARCLEKEPARRFQYVAEFAQALMPHAPETSGAIISRISGMRRSASLAPRVVSTPLPADSKIRIDSATVHADSGDVGKLSASQPREPSHERGQIWRWAAGGALIALISAGAVWSMRKPQPNLAPEALPPELPAQHSLPLDERVVRPVSPAVVAPDVRAVSDHGDAIDAGKAPVASAPASRARPRSTRPGVPRSKSSARPSPAPPPGAIDPLEGRR